MLRSFGPDLFLALPALIVALSFHEFAHAWVSTKLGDPTPRMRGRLTLNPLAHIDPIGFLMMLVFRFGWAKPVEVNPYNYDNREKGLALVSVAGPGINLLLGFFSTFLWIIAAVYMGVNAPLTMMLYFVVLYNVYFAVFNLLPLPPLDGSKLLFAFLPKRTVYRYLDTVSQYSTIILIALLWTGVIGSILGPVASAIINLYGQIAEAILLPFLG